MRVGTLKLALALLASATLAAALVGHTISAYSSATSSPGSTFATAASYATTCPGPIAADGFVTGFETGRRGYALGTVTASSTAMSIDGTAGAARTGDYALKVVTAGTTGYGQFQWLNLPYPTAQVVRFAMRLDAQPSTDLTQLFALSSGSAAVQLRYVQATNRFAVAIKRDMTTAPAVVAGTTPVQVGAWHVIDMRYNVGGASHTVDWRVDGTAQPGASTPGTSTTVSTTQFGTNAAETVQAHYDDVLMSRSAADYPLGDGRVFALWPNGMGTSVNPTHFQNDTGTTLDATSWQRLDEAPMADLTDYITQVTQNGASYAEVTLDDTAETCIRAAHATFSTHGPSSNQANNVKLSAFDGAAESVIRQGNMAANNTVSRNYAAPVAPAAASWTPAAVNGLVLRYGYGADIVPAQYLDSVLVEIESPR